MAEVTDDQEDQLPEVNFVPCVKFVGRGIASPRNIADVSEEDFFLFHKNLKFSDLINFFFRESSQIRM